MYALSEETLENIEKTLGISISDFSCMSADEKSGWLKKQHTKPVFSTKHRKIISSRVNPLISRRKIRTMEDLGKKSKALFGI